MSDEHTGERYEGGHPKFNPQCHCRFCLMKTTTEWIDAVKAALGVSSTVDVIPEIERLKKHQWVCNCEEKEWA